MLECKYCKSHFQPALLPSPFVICVLQELYQHKQQTTREISELNNILEKLRDENQALQAQGKAQNLEKKG